jgi:hypothetical protein
VSLPRCPGDGRPVRKRNATAAAPGPPGGAAPRRGPPPPRAPPSSTIRTATLLLAQRAEALSRYRRELLALYVKRIEEQAEASGALKAQLAAASANGRPQMQDAPPAEGQTGRSEWRRLFG